MTTIAQRIADDTAHAERMRLADAAPDMLATLRELQTMLEDWPTERALSAYGAQVATAKKRSARQKIADAIAKATGEDTTA